ncbi:MAG: IS110 family transposase, partial [Acetobacteraceae bacterium]
LSEYGYVFPQSITHAATLIAYVEDPNCTLPDNARTILKILIGSFTALQTQIKELDAKINRRSKEDAVARRLMTIPGIGEAAT